MSSMRRWPAAMRILFLTTARRLILRFGVLIAILAVALDPFSQQLLQLDSKLETFDVHDGRCAYAARTETYSTGALDCDSSAEAKTCHTTLSMGTSSAISTALTRSLEDLKCVSTLSCPVGNCAWPAFETLGVCHKCHDVAAEHAPTTSFDRYDFGRGHYNETLSFRALGWKAIALANGSCHHTSQRDLHRLSRVSDDIFQHGRTPKNYEVGRR